MALWTNTPPSWGARDPCEDGWDGIGCTNMRVVSLYVFTTYHNSRILHCLGLFIPEFNILKRIVFYRTLSSMNLSGSLSGDIQQLSELQIL